MCNKYYLYAQNTSHIYLKTNAFYTPWEAMKNHINRHFERIQKTITSRIDGYTWDYTENQNIFRKGQEKITY